MSLRRGTGGLMEKNEEVLGKFGMLQMWGNRISHILEVSIRAYFR